jgi:predicted permease
MEYIALIRYSVSGLMPLTCISVLGAILSYKKIFTQATINSISSQFSNFLSPIFIFFYITQAVSENNLLSLWPLFFTTLAMTLVCSLVSYIHSLIFGKHEKYPGVISSILVLSNIGNLPIVLLQGMCSDYGPFLRTNAGKRYCVYSNSYVSFQLLTYIPVLWSYGYSLINRDKEEHCPLLNKTEENPQITSNKQSIFMDFLKNLKSPNVISCLLGFLCGLIPGVDYFYDKRNIASCITNTGLSIGMASVVLSQMSLGSSIVLNSSYNLEMDKWYTASIVVFKNIMMPAVGFIFTYGLWEIGVFHDNIVMAYVAFIGFCCPTAVVVSVLSQLIGYGQKTTSMLMFFIYLSALPTLIFATFFFSIVFIPNQG